MRSAFDVLRIPSLKIHKKTYVVLKRGDALVFCLCVVQLTFLLVLPFSVSLCIFSDGGMSVFTYILSEVELLVLFCMLAVCLKVYIGFLV